MLVRVIKNRITDLPENLQEYAYGQDQDGLLDIEVGQEYDLYGVRYVGEDTFYLVNNPDYLWWMPSIFYTPDIEEIEHNVPDSWKKVEYGDDADLNERDLIIAPAIYHDNIHEIEDRTEIGLRVMKQMSEELK